MLIRSDRGNFEVTIGADPEFFVAKKGKVVSAYGLIPGDKKNPLKVKNGAVQVDGMALEFNIDPAKDYKQFDENITSVMGQLRQMTEGYEFKIEPVAEFGKKYIDEQPQKAKELGCDPDYNAYTGVQNPVPDGDRGFRTASGHIHIGWKKVGDKDWPDEIDPMDPGHFAACCALTKTLDAYLGIYSLAWDSDVKRRELYGAPGAFRPKPYGMEYRVLSNKWLDNPDLRAFIYGNTVRAFNDLLKDPDLAEKLYFGKLAKDIILLNDLNVVKEVSMVADFPRPKQYRTGEISPDVI